MPPRTLIACLGLAAVLAVAPTRAAEPQRGELAPREQNIWPAWVGRTDPAGHIESWQAVGPLFFSKNTAEGGTVSGLRPLWVERHDGAGELTEAGFLYPIWFYRGDRDTYQWSVFNLINRSGYKPGHAPADKDQSAGSTAEPADANFDLWPFYFSRRTGNPETSYRAVFPLYGHIVRRLYNDRIDWTLFPLYLRTENRGVVSTSVPWPFIRRTTGAGHDGFALWPLFGYENKPGEFSKKYFLWPLIYNNHAKLSEPQPTVQQGFLPFYARERSAEAVSENFVWPFFGYTDRTAPYRYHETRYFWPFFVQGAGDDRMVNRWGPFYTHSVIKGVDKTWVLWPLFRHAEWRDGPIAQTQDKFFFVLYWSQRQRSVTNPNAAPASRTHVWPLVSVWDNGAGLRQAQFPSPLDVFFPNNDRVRQTWTPLFALYRYDQRSPERVRHDFLWGAVTWRREEEHREFHLGPLFSSESTPERSRVAIGNGLLGWRREGTRWKFFLFDFSASSTTVSPAAAP